MATQHSPYGGPSPADFVLVTQRTAAAAAATVGQARGTREEARAAGEATADLWRPVIAEACQNGPRSPWHLPERLDSEVGEIQIDGDDAIIRPEIAETRRWEQDEEAALRKYVTPGSTVLDIGAHVGYFTLLMSQAVQEHGRVFAFEGDAWNHQLLVQNVLRNGARNVVPVYAALGAEPGIAHLRRDPGNNTGDHRVLDEASEWSHPVPVITLDSVLADVEEISFAKVDLQGADHLAILGMAETLRRCRPRMLVEFWPPGIKERGDDPVEVLGIYRSLGFVREVVDDLDIDPELPDDAFAHAAENTEREFVNLLLTPESR